MLRDVLEADRYPEIVFQSTNVTVTKAVEGQYRAGIIGDLTLRGIIRKGLWVQAQSQ